MSAEALVKWLPSLESCSFLFLNFKGKWIESKGQLLAGQYVFPTQRITIDEIASSNIFVDQKGQGSRNGYFLTLRPVLVTRFRRRNRVLSAPYSAYNMYNPRCIVSIRSTLTAIQYEHPFGGLEEADPLQELRKALEDESLSPVSKLLFKNAPISPKSPAHKLRQPSYRLQDTPPYLSRVAFHLHMFQEHFNDIQSNFDQVDTYLKELGEGHPDIVKNAQLMKEKARIEVIKKALQDDHLKNVDLLVLAVISPMWGHLSYTPIQIIELIEQVIEKKVTRHAPVPKFGVEFPKIMAHYEAILDGKFQREKKEENADKSDIKESNDSASSSSRKNRKPSRSRSQSQARSQSRPRSTAPALTPPSSSLSPLPPPVLPSSADDAPMPPFEGPLTPIISLDPDLRGLEIVLAIFAPLRAKHHVYLSENHFSKYLDERKQVEEHNAALVQNQMATLFEFRRAQKTRKIVILDHLENPLPPLRLLPTGQFIQTDTATDADGNIISLLGEGSVGEGDVRLRLKGPRKQKGKGAKKVKKDKNAQNAQQNNTKKAPKVQNSAKKVPKSTTKPRNSTVLSAIRSALKKARDYAIERRKNSEAALEQGPMDPKELKELQKFQDLAFSNPLTARELALSGKFTNEGLQLLLETCGYNNYQDYENAAEDWDFYQAEAGNRSEHNDLDRKNKNDKKVKKILQNTEKMIRNAKNGVSNSGAKTSHFLNYHQPPHSAPRFSLENIEFLTDEEIDAFVPPHQWAYCQDLLLQKQLSALSPPQQAHLKDLYSRKLVSTLPTFLDLWNQVVEQKVGAPKGAVAQNAQKVILHSSGSSGSSVSARLPPSLLLQNHAVINPTTNDASMRQFDTKFILAHPSYAKLEPSFPTLRNLPLAPGFNGEEGQGADGGIVAVVKLQRIVKKHCQTPPQIPPFWLDRAQIRTAVSALGFNLKVSLNRPKVAKALSKAEAFGVLERVMDFLDQQIVVPPYLTQVPVSLVTYDAKTQVTSLASYPGQLISRNGREGKKSRSGLYYQKNLLHHFDFQAPYTQTSVLIQIALNPKIGEYIESIYGVPDVKLRKTHSACPLPLPPLTSILSRFNDTKDFILDLLYEELARMVLKGTRQMAGKGADGIKMHENGQFDPIRTLVEQHNQSHSRLDQQEWIMMKITDQLLGREDEKAEDNANSQHYTSKNGRNVKPKTKFEPNASVSLFPGLPQLPQHLDILLSSLQFDPLDIWNITTELGVLFYTNDVVLDHLLINKETIWRRMRQREFLLILGFTAETLADVDYFLMRVLEALPQDWYVSRSKFAKIATFLYLYFELLEGSSSYRSQIYETTEATTNSYINHVKNVKKQRGWSGFCAQSAKFQNFYHYLVLNELCGQNGQNNQIPIQNDQNGQNFENFENPGPQMAQDGAYGPIHQDPLLLSLLQELQSGAGTPQENITNLLQGNSAFGAQIGQNGPFGAKLGLEFDNNDTDPDASTDRLLQLQKLYALANNPLASMAAVESELLGPRGMLGGDTHTNKSLVKAAQKENDINNPLTLHRLAKKRDARIANVPVLGLADVKVTINSGFEGDSHNDVNKLKKGQNHKNTLSTTQNAPHPLSSNHPSQSTVKTKHDNEVKRNMELREYEKALIGEWKGQHAPLTGEIDIPYDKLSTPLPAQSIAQLAADRNVFGNVQWQRHLEGPPEEEGDADIDGDGDGVQTGQGGNGHHGHNGGQHSQNSPNSHHSVQNSQNFQNPPNPHPQHIQNSHNPQHIQNSHPSQHIQNSHNSPNIQNSHSSQHFHQNPQNIQNSHYPQNSQNSPNSPNLQNSEVPYGSSRTPIQQIQLDQNGHLIPTSPHPAPPPLPYIAATSLCAYPTHLTGPPHLQTGPRGPHHPLGPSCSPLRVLPAQFDANGQLMQGSEAGYVVEHDFGGQDSAVFTLPFHGRFVSPQTLYSLVELIRVSPELAKNMPVIDALREKLTQALDARKNKPASKILQSLTMFSHTLTFGPGSKPLLGMLTECTNTLSRYQWLGMLKALHLWNIGVILRNELFSILRDIMGGPNSPLFARFCLAVGFNHWFDPIQQQSFHRQAMGGRFSVDMGSFTNRVILATNSAYLQKKYYFEQFGNKNGQNWKNYSNFGPLGVQLESGLYKFHIAMFQNTEILAMNTKRLQFVREMDRYCSKMITFGQNYAQNGQNGQFLAQNGQFDGKISLLALLKLIYACVNQISRAGALMGKAQNGQMVVQNDQNLQNSDKNGQSSQNWSTLQQVIPNLYFLKLAADQLPFVAMIETDPPSQNSQNVQNDQNDQTMTENQTHNSVQNPVQNSQKFQKSSKKRGSQPQRTEKTTKFSQPIHALTPLHPLTLSLRSFITHTEANLMSKYHNTIQVPKPVAQSVLYDIDPETAQTLHIDENGGLVQMDPYGHYRPYHPLPNLKIAKFASQSTAEHLAHVNHSLKHSFRLISSQDEKVLTPNRFIGSELLQFSNFVANFDLASELPRLSPSYYPLPSYLEHPVQSSYEWVQKGELELLAGEQEKWDKMDLLVWYEKKFEKMRKMFQKYQSQLQNSTGQLQATGSGHVVLFGPQNQQNYAQNGQNYGQNDLKLDNSYRLGAHVTSKHSPIIDLINITIPRLQIFNTTAVRQLRKIQKGVGKGHFLVKNFQNSSQIAQIDNFDQLDTFIPPSPQQQRLDPKVVMTSQLGFGYPYSLLGVLSSDYYSTGPTEQEVILNTIAQVAKSQQNLKKFEKEQNAQISQKSQNAAENLENFSTFPDLVSHISTLKRTSSTSLLKSLLLQSYNPRRGPAQSIADDISGLRDWVLGLILRFKSLKAFLAKLHTKISFIPSLTDRLAPLNSVIPARHMELLATLYPDNGDNTQTDLNLAQNGQNGQNNGQNGQNGQNNQPQPPKLSTLHNTNPSNMITLLKESPYITIPVILNRIDAAVVAVGQIRASLVAFWLKGAFLARVKPNCHTDLSSVAFTPHSAYNLNVITPEIISQKPLRVQERYQRLPKKILDEITILRDKMNQKRAKSAIFAQSFQNATRGDRNAFLAQSMQYYAQYEPYEQLSTFSARHSGGYTTEVVPRTYEIAVQMAIEVQQRHNEAKMGKKGQNGTKNGQNGKKSKKVQKHQSLFDVGVAMDENGLLNPIVAGLETCRDEPDGSNFTENGQNAENGQNTENFTENCQNGENVDENGDILPLLDSSLCYCDPHSDYIRSFRYHYWANQSDEAKGLHDHLVYCPQNSHNSQNSAQNSQFSGPPSEITKIVEIFDISRYAQTALPSSASSTSSSSVPTTTTTTTTTTTNPSGFYHRLVVPLAQLNLEESVTLQQLTAFSKFPFSPFSLLGTIFPADYNIHQNLFTINNILTSNSTPQKPNFVFFDQQKQKNAILTQNSSLFLTHDLPADPNAPQTSASTALVETNGQMVAEGGQNGQNGQNSAQNAQISQNSEQSPVPLTNTSLLYPSLADLLENPTTLSQTIYQQLDYQRRVALSGELGQNGQNSPNVAEFTQNLQNLQNSLHLSSSLAKSVVLEASFSKPSQFEPYWALNTIQSDRYVLITDYVDFKAGWDEEWEQLGDQNSTQNGQNSQNSQNFETSALISHETNPLFLDALSSASLSAPTNRPAGLVGLEAQEGELVDLDVLATNPLTIPAIRIPPQPLNSKTNTGRKHFGVEGCGKNGLVGASCGGNGHKCEKSAKMGKKGRNGKKSMLPQPSFLYSMLPTNESITCLTSTRVDTHCGDCGGEIRCGGPEEMGETFRNFNNGKNDQNFAQNDQNAQKLQKLSKMGSPYLVKFKSHFSSIVHHLLLSFLAHQIMAFPICSVGMLRTTLEYVVHVIWAKQLHLSEKMVENGKKMIDLYVSQFSSRFQHETALYSQLLQVQRLRNNPVVGWERYQHNPPGWDDVEKLRAAEMNLENQNQNLQPQQQQIKSENFEILQGAENSHFLQNFQNSPISPKEKTPPFTLGALGVQFDLQGFYDFDEFYLPPTQPIQINSVYPILGSEIQTGAVGFPSQNGQNSVKTEQNFAQNFAQNVQNAQNSSNSDSTPLSLSVPLPTSPDHQNLSRQLILSRTLPLLKRSPFSGKQLLNSQNSKTPLFERILTLCSSSFASQHSPLFLYNNLFSTPTGVVFPPSTAMPANHHNGFGARPVPLPEEIFEDGPTFGVLTAFSLTTFQNAVQSHPDDKLSTKLMQDLNFFTENGRFEVEYPEGQGQNEQNGQNRPNLVQNTFVQNFSQNGQQFQNGQIVQNQPEYQPAYINWGLAPNSADASILSNVDLRDPLCVYKMGLDLSQFGENVVYQPSRWQVCQNAQNSQQNSHFSQNSQQNAPISSSQNGQRYIFDVQGSLPIKMEMGVGEEVKNDQNSTQNGQNGQNSTQKAQNAQNSVKNGLIGFHGVLHHVLPDMYTSNESIALSISRYGFRPHSIMDYLENSIHNCVQNGQNSQNSAQNSIQNGPNSAQNHAEYRLLGHPTLVHGQPCPVLDTASNGSAAAKLAALTRSSGVQNAQNSQNYAQNERNGAQVTEIALTRFGPRKNIQGAGQNVPNGANLAHNQQNQQNQQNSFNSDDLSTTLLPMIATPSLYISLRLYQELYERLYPIVSSQAAYHDKDAYPANHDQIGQNGQNVVQNGQNFIQNGQHSMSDSSSPIVPSIPGISPGLPGPLSDEDILDHLSQTPLTHSPVHLKAFEWLTYQLIHNKIGSQLYEYECAVLFGVNFQPLFYTMHGALVQLCKQILNLCSNSPALKSIALYDFFILSMQLKHISTHNLGTSHVGTILDHLGGIQKHNHALESLPTLSPPTSLIPFPISDCQDAYLVQQYSSMCFFELGRFGHLFKIVQFPHSGINAITTCQNPIPRQFDPLQLPALHYHAMFQTVFSDKDFTWTIYEQMYQNFLLFLKKQTQQTLTSLQTMHSLVNNSDDAMPTYQYNTKLHREVKYDGDEAAGTVVVNNPHPHLVAPTSAQSKRLREAHGLLQSLFEHYHGIMGRGGEDPVQKVQKLMSEATKPSQTLSSAKSSQSAVQTQPNSASALASRFETGPNLFGKDCVDLVYKNRVIVFNRPFSTISTPSSSSSLTSSTHPSLSLTQLGINTNTSSDEAHVATKMESGQSMGESGQNGQNGQNLSQKTFQLLSQDLFPSSSSRFTPAATANPRSLNVRTMNPTLEKETLDGAQGGALEAQTETTQSLDTALRRSIINPHRSDKFRHLYDFTHNGPNTYNTVPNELLAPRLRSRDSRSVKAVPESYYCNSQDELETVALMIYLEDLYSAVSLERYQRQAYETKVATGGLEDQKGAQNGLLTVNEAQCAPALIYSMKYVPTPFLKRNIGKSMRAMVMGGVSDPLLCTISTDNTTFSHHYHRSKSLTPIALAQTTNENSDYKAVPSYQDDGGINFSSFHRLVPFQKQNSYLKSMQSLLKSSSALNASAGMGMDTEMSNGGTKRKNRGSVSEKSEKADPASLSDVSATITPSQLAPGIKLGPYEHETAYLNGFKRQRPNNTHPVQSSLHRDRLCGSTMPNPTQSNWTLDADLSLAQVDENTFVVGGSERKAVAPFPTIVLSMPPPDPTLPPTDPATNGTAEDRVAVYNGLLPSDLVLLNASQGHFSSILHVPRAPRLPQLFPTVDEVAGAALALTAGTGTGFGVKKEEMIKGEQIKTEMGDFGLKTEMVKNEQFLPNMIKTELGTAMGTGMGDNSTESSLVFANLSPHLKHQRGYSARPPAIEISAEQQKERVDRWLDVVAKLSRSVAENPQNGQNNAQNNAQNAQNSTVESKMLVAQAEAFARAWYHQHLQPQVFVVKGYGQAEQEPKQ